MNILIVEPYFTGSHQQWIEGLVTHSSHHCEVLSLRGKYWKWRMSGGAISLASKTKETTFQPDLILCSDMLDLALFKSLLPKKTKEIPLWVYFHENQLTYPFQDKKSMDRHYGFINYTSALVADRVLFNSDYHRLSFLSGLSSFLKVFPDERNLYNIDTIRSKSMVLHLGLEFPKDIRENKNKVPTFIWNHRWEYDKNPDLFFKILFQLKENGVRFKLNVLGESFADSPPIFEEAKHVLANEIEHWGYANTKQEYFEVLRQSNLLVVTSKQDFFGISVVEAIAMGCFPILPSRLAFPEIIPFESYFYQQDEHLLPKITKVLETKPYLVIQDELVNFVERYHWRNIISKYDDLFQSSSSSF